MLGNQSLSGTAGAPHHVLVYECQTPADCADDGSVCTVTTCAAGLCTHPAGNAGATCRTSAGECDLGESCDGVNAACPADARRTAGAACGADAETCTADVCDGTGTACTHPAGNAGVTCRAAAGGCDVAESCNGTAPTCPADVLVSGGTACRAAVGTCDVAETCSGSSAVCPADVLVANGTTCRASAGVCDVAESCTGTSGVCPADVFVGSGTQCRASVNSCDPAEQCTGASALCPNDVGPQDGDADGVCDASDPCTNLAGAQDFKLLPKSKVVLAKINTDTVSGNDTLSLLGVFDLPAGHAFGEVSPQATGARLVLRNAAGGTELDVTLPGGAYGGSGTRGWKRNGSGTTWTYLDKTTDGTLSSAHGGISQLQILDRSKRTPREVMIKAKGKAGTYPVVAADSPIEAIVVLGGQAAGQAGLCGESAWSATNCAFNGPGSTLKCLR